MAVAKLTHRLPQARVSRELYRKVKQVADAQGMSVADVQRAALEFYCAPMDAPTGQNISVPVVGIIKDGQIIPYRKAA